MNQASRARVPRVAARRRRSLGAGRPAGVAFAAAAAWLGFCAAMPAGQDALAQDQGQPTLEETRLTMSKWIETQQIISKERRDWQQGKEILQGRIDLVRQELAALEEKIAQAESSAAEVDAKRVELQAENQGLQDMSRRLTEAVAGLESRIPPLFRVTPEPIRPQLEVLYERIPEDPSTTKVSVAERYQNVLGILSLLGKANNEITTGYEVRKLADGSSVEVQALYVGLAQAYYVSAHGEAGAGHPTPEGWQWEPSKAIAGEVLKSLEILQGKQTPAFVSLPVKFQ